MFQNTKGYRSSPAVITDFIFRDAGTVFPQNTVGQFHSIDSAGCSIEVNGAAFELSGIAIERAVGQLVLGIAFRAGEGSGKDGAPVKGCFVVIEDAAESLADIDGALAAPKVKRAPILLAAVTGKETIGDTVIRQALVEGSPVKNSAAVSSGQVIDKAGIADHIVGFGVGAGEHPNGATAAEIPFRCIVFEQAAVNAYGGGALVQVDGAGYTNGYGATVIAGIVVAKSAADELWFNGGAHGGGHKNGCPPADSK